MECGLDEAVIGIIEQGASDGVVDRAVRTVRNAGGTPVVGTAAELLGTDPSVLDAEPDAVVAFGERAFLSAGRIAGSVPLLPVEAGAGVRSISEGTIESSLKTLVTESVELVDQCRYEVAVDGTSTNTIVSDAMLVTEEPARISEYSIHTAGSRVAQFRADGVVVATPSGSHGYAAAARGPTLAPGTGIVAVPIAQFATDRDSWVLGPNEPITLRIERDDGPVELLVDDCRDQLVDAGTDITLTPGAPLRIVTVAESEPYWQE